MPRQENPKKTLLKWTPIDADKIEQTLAQPGTQAVTSLKNSAEGSSIEDTHLSGGDYFVPWHLPKHRLPSATGDEGEASSLSPALREPMHAVKDEEKGTVMYNRYAWQGSTFFVLLFSWVLHSMCDVFDTWLSRRRGAASGLKTRFDFYVCVHLKIPFWNFVLHILCRLGTVS